MSIFQYVAGEPKTSELLDVIRLIIAQLLSDAVILVPGISLAFSQVGIEPVEDIFYI